MKINYLFYQHLSGVTIFLWKQQKTKYYYYKTTTTNYFFCFLKWSKTSIVRIARPSPSKKTNNPMCFLVHFFSWGKKIVMQLWFLFFTSCFKWVSTLIFRATESEWCDIFHPPKKLIIIIIIIITILLHTFYHFTKLFFKKPQKSKTYLSSNIGSSICHLIFQIIL